MPLQLNQLSVTQRQNESSFTSTRQRAPIKISPYKKSGDKTKIVINDKTLLAKPDDMDYTFQYYDDADQQQERCYQNGSNLLVK